MCCKSIGVLAVILGLGFVGAVYMGGGYSSNCSSGCGGAAACCESVGEPSLVSSCCQEQGVAACTATAQESPCCSSYKVQVAGQPAETKPATASTEDTPKLEANAEATPK
jgi:hypothetical protein